MFNGEAANCRGTECFLERIKSVAECCCSTEHLMLEVSVDAYSLMMIIAEPVVGLCLEL